MEIHPSLLTVFLAKILGVEDFHHFALYDHVIGASLAFVLLLALMISLRSRLSLVPGHFQQVIELTVEGILGMLEENIGSQGRKFIPLIGALAFFIFVCNMLGLVPGFSAATGNFNTTVACAVIVFLYYNFQGIKTHGFGYIKHFCGPMWWMAPLMFPIEIISHIARPFSLSVRLFGNMSGEHIVSLVFYGLVPFLLPVPLLALGLFVAFLQTFIFVMLATIYIAGAVSHEH